AMAMIPRQHYENHRLTDENFERIANGMTQAEVEKILGPATSVETYGHCGSKVTWESRRMVNHKVYTRIVGIGFDGNGRSCTTPYEGMEHVSDDWWLRFWGLSPWLAKQLDGWLPR